MGMRKYLLLKKSLCLLMGQTDGRLWSAATWKALVCLMATRQRIERRNGSRGIVPFNKEEKCIWCGLTIRSQRRLAPSFPLSRFTLVGPACLSSGR